MKTHLCLPGIRPYARAMCGRKEPELRSILSRNVDCGHCLRVLARVRRDVTKKWRATCSIPPDAVS